MSERKCCGTCKYHQFEGIDEGYVCVNSESEFLSDWTEYGYSCPEWEGKHGED